MLELAKQIISLEAQAVISLLDKLDSNFDIAVERIIQCKGRIILTGMGKAGIIAQKISATFASTGTPSLYLHPAEAYHGDLGRVTKNDIVIALSNSGQTEEIVKLIPYIKKIGAQIISITSHSNSTLAKFSDIVLLTGVLKEADPLGLAPSTTTTVMLVLGDALALCVLKKRNFTKEEFALYHPGGELGRKLLKVEEIMRQGKNCPAVSENATIKEALFKITESRAGAVNVVSDDGILIGFFTDGDFRRLASKETEILDKPIKIFMTKNPKVIKVGSLVEQAMQILSEYKIDELPVVTDEGKLVGMIDIQDIVAIK